MTLRCGVASAGGSMLTGPSLILIFVVSQQNVSTRGRGQYGVNK